eukprot:4548832-Pyramimonas_sp.AAC.1
MVPDMPVLDHEGQTETSYHNREHTIRRVSIEAITQATTVAKTSRALLTKTTITGQHCYKEGDIVDYHRPTTTKDDWGGRSRSFKTIPTRSNYRVSWESRCTCLLRWCKTLALLYKL